MRRFSASLLVLMACIGRVEAGVLSDDRADALYHRYDGGGVTIDGPSVLVRKKFGENFAVSANYYVDKVTSASLDVVTQASPYTEERKQWSLGAEALRGKTTYSIGYIDSTESDYLSNTTYFNISNDMFGDLTTVSFGYAHGRDTVGRRGSPAFQQPVTRRDYSVGLSQILTKKLIASLNFQTSESEGFLNNPYRQVRYLDALEPLGYSWQFERYPQTRAGNALGANLKYHLPWRAALDGHYRYYTDTWGIDSHTARLGYTHPLFSNWTVEGHARFYRQTQADFYSDLFPFRSAQNFLARDRELSQFSGSTFGFTATWDFKIGRAAWLERGTLNLSYDRLGLSYDNFRDVRLATPVPGAEPLYRLDADVMQLFLSIWF